MRARLRCTPLAPRAAAATLAILAAATLSACESVESMTGDANVASLPQLALVEDLRIGSLDDPEAGFSSIAAVDVDADGNAYVLERQEDEVRVYAPDGTRLRTIGRQGSGPGEFESPYMMGVIGDTVWVSDTRLRRITLFTRAGDLLATVDANGVPVATHGGLTVNARPYRLRPGGLLESTHSFSRMPGEQLDGSIVAPRVLFDLSGAVVDTVAFDTVTPPRPISESDLIRVGNIPIARSSGPYDEPFSIATPDDGKIVVDRPIAATGDDSEFTVTRLNNGGDTVYHRAFRYTPTASTGALIDSIMSRQANEFARMIGTPVDVDELRDALRSAWAQPPYQIPVTLAQLGADESLWLRREETGNDAYTWIVLAPDGSPRGQVTIPRRDVIRRYSVDELWAASPDEYDVQWLVRYVVTNASSETER